MISHDAQLYVRAMEERGLAPTTIDRRLSTVCELLPLRPDRRSDRRQPAQYVRRPNVHRCDARGLDRSELGAFLFAAERFDAAHAALAVLLGLNGLRVSEARSTDIESLGFERGHRTLRIVGNGNKPAVVPLVPRSARTIDLAIGERTAGPILRRHDGQRLDPTYGPSLSALDRQARRHRPGSPAPVKRALYEQLGVPAYWLVDPATASMVVFWLHRGRYLLEVTATGSDVRESDCPFAVRVVPGELLR